MTVYIVVDDSGESYYIDSVYDTDEKAREREKLIEGYVVEKEVA